MNNPAYMHEHEDTHLLNKNILLRQPKEGFRASIDSVLLAAACRASGNDTILDMGCGVGAVTLCLLHRLKNVHVTGIERQEVYKNLAEENASLNGFGERAHFIQACVTDFNVDTKDHRFDHIVSNPPYFGNGSHLISPNVLKAEAMAGEDIPEIWIKKAFDLLKPKGELVLINPADCLVRIINALGKKFGAVEIIPLWPKQGRNAKRIIVRAIKNRKSAPVIHHGLILHKEDGDYTNEANAILRDGKSIETNTPTNGTSGQ